MAMTRFERKKLNAATRLAMAFAQRIAICVCIIVGMTLWALRFRKVSREERITAQEILTRGHWLKVGRIYAGSVSAQMIDAQTIWNWSIRAYIRETVSIDTWSACGCAMAKHAIAARQFLAGPIPALGSTVARDEAFEADSWRYTAPHVAKLYNKSPIGVLY